jgi:hypothetical protein
MSQVKTRKWIQEEINTLANLRDAYTKNMELLPNVVHILRMRRDEIDHEVSRLSRLYAKPWWRRLFA